VEEFGPYAVSDKIPACVAPIGVVEACYAEGRSCRRHCPWFLELPDGRERLSVAGPVLVDHGSDGAVVLSFRFRPRTGEQTVPQREEGLRKRHSAA